MPVPHSSWYDDSYVQKWGSRWSLSYEKDYQIAIDCT